ncbi:CD1375 family protein [Brevibacillus gelatini]|uniref:CD1375 family protein n=1 Tax=Brevibacillus gelatini TaxID=1655277 RepID=UPI003D81BE97
MLKSALVNLGIWHVPLKGGEKPVVAIYVALIVAGRRTYDSVPTPLKPAVKEELEALGLSTDGAPLA